LREKRVERAAVAVLESDKLVAETSAVGWLMVEWSVVEWRTVEKL
jgi:hypothetical protein